MNLWRPKFEAIMAEFLEFDNERRRGKMHIFPEIYGEMTLDILGHQILITAIADRIEVDQEGRVYILDYKTGAIPTRQDIMRGISVQMLVEAMIADIGGFAGIHGSVHEMIYVKIASRAPYITTQIYNAAECNIAAHRDGLIKILSYYAAGAPYLVNDNKKFAPKYNDYEHLAREE